MKNIFYLLFLSLLLTGCGPKSTFVLMPNPDGTIGEMTITTDKGTQTLTEARQSVLVSGKESAPGETKTMGEQEIEAIFGKVIEIQPLPPIKFLLYFYFDSIRMHAKSKKKIPLIVQATKERESMDISVNGHTDSAGDAQYNYLLSVRRAKGVQKSLIKSGINPDIITTTSHGEGNPLIPTADNVVEPKNRRVEVIIR
jgi:outer membrane protein OmpA-like peptidoglycan-associated protein